MTEGEDVEETSSRGWERRDPQDLLDAMDVGEPYTTGELADRLSWPTRSTYHVLDGLADDGKVWKKKPDPRRAIWMLKED